MCTWSNLATLISSPRKIWTFRAVVNNENRTKSLLSIASILSSLHGLTRSMWHPAASSDRELWAPWWLQPRPLRDHSVAGRERLIHPLSVRKVKSDVTKAERPLRANHRAGRTDRRETQSPACFWLIVTDGAECVRSSGLLSTDVLVSMDRCTLMCTAKCSENVSLLLFLCLTLTHKHKHCIWRSSWAEKDFQRQWQRPLKCEKWLKLRIVPHLSIYVLCFLWNPSSIFDPGDLGG